MAGEEGENDYTDLVGIKNPRDTIIQIGVSIALGVGAFLTFCVLRPRWTSLYAARKQLRNQASPLPELPSSMFGWIPALWSITEQQTLASAGLDAYVFLRFFKMALKFLTVTLFFALVVFKPVHDAFPEKSGNSTTIDNEFYKPGFITQVNTQADVAAMTRRSIMDGVSTDYLWMYLIFAYLFTALAVYLLFTETERIIGIRQEYLGNQATITDRTIRLSGIPPELRSEEKTKEFVEALEIGKVDSVMLCRNWKELDDLMDRRVQGLRKLEESWTLYLGRRRMKEHRQSDSHEHAQPTIPNETGDEENGPLLGGNAVGNAKPVDPIRPTATIRYGFMKLRSRYVDAIDYYEEKLRRVDEKILELRNRTFKPTPLAFVTLDSVAACQMAVQAVLDPSPMHLLAKPAPAPNDVVWANTYQSRPQRMLRGWIITIIITVLTVFWSVLLVPVAGVLQPSSIKQVWPQLAHAIESNKLIKSLITTQLPTLLSTLLFVAVPYLYDWLANFQGIMSQGDIELSVISKNFFFSFFNYFIVFTALGSFAYFYEIIDRFRDSLRDTTWVASQLAQSLQRLSSFYTNLIILQGLGLFPLRLLEIGSVSLYPFYRMAAKTPRDFAELNQPASFNYGFYLPQVMLIFIICIVYSILRDSWQVLLAGIIYFAIGGFVYKYQLLYAMDHRQHSTGRAWTMICKRMIMGLIVFQLTTAGQLLLKRAEFRSAAMAPLILGTVWFSYAYSKTYDPLMEFIALRSIERKAPEPDNVEMDPDGWGESARLRYEAESRPDAVDESDETGVRFVNPSLVKPLEDVWITDKAERNSVRTSSPRRRLTTTMNAL